MNTNRTPWRVIEFKRENYSSYTNSATVPVHKHPLEEKKRYVASWAQPKPQIEKNADKEDCEFQDPLGALNDGDDNSLDILDVPITKPYSHSLDNTLEMNNSPRSAFDFELPDFIPWREKRLKIVSLSKRDNRILSQSDKIKQRLKIFQETDFGNPKRREIIDYPTTIAKLRESLLNAWENNQRIITNVGVVLEKMAAIDTDEFPYHWLLAVDVLDTFGKLVFDRLVNKANEERKRIGQNELGSLIRSDMIPPTAKEMAKHWFLKVSEIEDIIVRFYVETSLIACLNFLDSPAIPVNLERLATICTTFPQNLSAYYARAYICRISMFIDPTDRRPHWRCLHDWMQSQDKVDIMNYSNDNPNIARTKKLAQPAVDWIVQCVSYGAHTKDDLSPIWAYCSKTPIDLKTYLLINGIVNGLPSKFLAIYPKDILEIALLLKESTALAQFGRRMCDISPASDDKKFLKKIVWRKIAENENFADFVECSIEWTKFVAKNFPSGDVLKILELLLSRFKDVGEEIREDCGIEPLLDVVAALIDNFPNAKNCLPILAHSNFLKLVDVIGDEYENAVKCADVVLKSIAQKFKRGTIDDFQIASMILEQSTIMCQNVLFKLSSSEATVCEELIAKALSTIDFKSRKDRMQGLDMITKARGALGLSEIILEEIIAILLDFTIDSIVNYPKKSEFLRVCVVNLAVTVPAVHDATRRFRYSLKVLNVCMMINYLPEIDTECKRCVECLNELAKTTRAQKLAPMIAEYLAVLCRVPDAPQKGKPLYHFGKLMAFIEKNETEWAKEAKGYWLAEILVRCVRYLCAVRQLDEMPGAIRGNDVLYMGDEEFLHHIDSKIDYVISKLLPLANEASVAILILENFLVLFEVTEEIRSTIRGLLKRAATNEKYTNRLNHTINNLREMATSNEIVMNILEKLSLA
ncbi:unnamed protein product [Caenorhabditis bovis]|uniref:Uncharacterized protein n=1 Tax=Caenorhabditis bovis TaxID=2654633 RepID=A0A8S1FBL9_9PELO|nr:unnamed protein product [Caenorhabditis bovis]